MWPTIQIRCGRCHLSLTLMETCAKDRHILVDMIIKARPLKRESAFNARLRQLVLNRCGRYLDIIRNHNVTIPYKNDGTHIRYRDAEIDFSIGRPLTYNITMCDE